MRLWRSFRQYLEDEWYTLTFSGILALSANQTVELGFENFGPDAQMTIHEETSFSGKWSSKLRSLHCDTISQSISQGTLHCDTISQGTLHCDTLSQGTLHCDTISQGTLHCDTISQGPLHCDTISQSTPHPVTDL